jgi:hypothetical protein
MNRILKKSNESVLYRIQHNRALHINKVYLTFLVIYESMFDEVNRSYRLLFSKEKLGTYYSFLLYFDCKIAT